MKKMKSTALVIVLCLAVAAICLSVRTELSPGKIFAGDVMDTEGTWSIEKDGKDTYIQYECSLQNEKNNEPQVLLLQSHWSDYSIFADHKKIYDTEGKRVGYVHLFQIPQAEELSIRFESVNTASVSAIRQSKIVVGDRSGIYMKIVGENLYAAFFAVLALFVSCVSVGVGFYMKKTWTEEICRCLKYLGCYIFCTGLWILTDSKLLLLVTQKTELVELISFLAFFSLPFPLLGFTKILMPGKEKMFGKLQGCFWMMAVIYTVNYMAELLPVIAVIVAEHFFMVITIILVLYYGACNIRKHKNEKILRVMLGYITFSIFSIAAFAFFYRGDSIRYSVCYMIGISGLVFFLMNAACLALYEQMEKSANAAVYARMAYLDLMTGLGNRTAFLQDKKAAEKDQGEIAYIMIDANNLKKINDSQGHQKGDELLLQVSHSIREAVQDKGICYRIGGDEFVVCLSGCTEKEVSQCAEQIGEEIRKADRLTEIEVSAAVGYAWTDGTDRDLDALLQRADEKMYENKQKMKRKRRTI